VKNNKYHIYKCAAAAAAAAAATTQIIIIYQLVFHQIFFLFYVLMGLINAVRLVYSILY
jgi:hypothetical protein